jgi:hypothetical protein
VFFSEEEAAGALVGLTDPSEFYDSESIAPLQVRRAKTVPDKESIKLQIRVATEQDKKERGARARSKYYLMHGEPTRQLERSRRKQEDELIVSHLDKQRVKRQAETDDLLPGVLAKEIENDLFPDMAKDLKVAREVKWRLADPNRRRKEHADFSNRLRVRSRSPLRSGRDSDVIDNGHDDLLPGIKGQRSYLSGNAGTASKASRDRSRSPENFGSRLDISREQRPNRHKKNRRKAADLF